jgi:hypothetical protein
MQKPQGDLQMKTVFLVHHVREDESGYENVKLIGVYSSQVRAEAALASPQSCPRTTGASNLSSRSFQIFLRGTPG